MAETTFTVQCYLKGSVQTSIDSSGVITKTFTWMVLNQNETNTLLEWLAFQDYVEHEWAGHIGDNWKKPIQIAGEKECTSYATDDSSFLVDNISAETPSGRTHVEVTYTCVGNGDIIKRFTEGGLSINASDERSKSFSFKYNVPQKDVTFDGNTWKAPDLAAVESTIDGLFKINDKVEWADSIGHTYVVDNVSVSQESPTVYNVNVSLKDMAKMRIGLVSVNEDSFGQKTLSVTWRLSKEVYDDTTLPSSGDELGTWLGDGYEGTDYDKFIVTGVEHSPDGILGYLVTINAKDTTMTQLHTQRDYRWNGTGLEKSASVVYQLHSKEDAEQFLDNLGRETLDVDGESFTIRDANITQNGKEDYELTLSLSDEGTPLIVNVGSNTPDDLAKDIQVSMIYGSFYLTPEQCGLKRTVSNLDYYEINNPPTQKVKHTILAQDLFDFGWTPDYIRQCLGRNPPEIGFSYIVNVLNSLGNPIKEWRTKASTLQFSPTPTDKVGYVNELVVRDFVYPQPWFTQQGFGGEQLYNPIFVPWIAKDSLLIIPGGSKTGNQYIRLDLSNWPKYGGLDKALPTYWLNRKIPYMDCSVTMNYRGNLQTVLSQSWGELFINAVNQVCNKANLVQQRPDPISTTLSPTRTYSDFNKYFLMPYETVANKQAKYPLTSFKRTSMSVAKVIDSTGKEWTQVTMGIQALLGDFWNPYYKEKVDFA